MLTHAPFNLQSSTILRMNTRTDKDITGPPHSLTRSERGT